MSGVSPGETAKSVHQVGHLYETKSNLVIDPKKSSFRLWESFVNFTILVTCLVESLLASFDSTTKSLWAIAVVCDIIFLTHVILKFNTGYVDSKGIIVKERKIICISYLRSTFVLDALSLFPFGIFTLAIDDPAYVAVWAALRLNRLIRCYQLLLFFERRESQLGSRVLLLRGIKYLCVCVLTTHWSTCWWYAQACSGVHSGRLKICTNFTWGNNHVYDLGLNVSAAGAPESYVVSLYWAVATTSSTGFMYDDIAAINMTERWITILVTAVGIAVFYGMLLGGLTSMLSNLDQRRALFVHRFNTIKQDLKDKGVAEEQMEVVIGYYEYMWVRKKGFITDGIYDVLPLTFQSEIHSGILAKAPLFENMESGFMRMLSLHIKQVLYLPNQVIVTRGDPGHQMFFIHRGEVEVLSDEDDSTAVAILKSGKLFGEVSLFYSLPRTATIRANTHCDIMVLEREDVQHLLPLYPAAAKKLYEVAKERCSYATRVLTRVEDQKANIKAFNVTTQSGMLPTQSRRNSILDSVRSMDSKSKSLISLGINVPTKKSSIAMGDNIELITSERSFLVIRWPFCSRVRDLLETAMSITLNPVRPFYRGWQYFIIFITVTICFLYPYMATFTAYDPRKDYFELKYGSLLLTFSYMLDTFLLIDILINLRTDIPTSQGTLSSIYDIVQYYCKTWQFVIDLLSLLPIELFCFVEPAGSARRRLFSFLKLNRMLKVLKLAATFNKLEENIYVSAFKVRSCKFLLYIAMTSHWCACVGYSISCFGDSCSEKSWLLLWYKEHGIALEDVTPTLEYVTCLYWAVGSMTNTGNGDIQTKTTIGQLVTLMAMLAGVLVFGYCLAAMAATLAGLDIPRVAFQERLFTMTKFMKERNIDPELGQRVINYMMMLWNRHQGMWMPGWKPLVFDMPISLQQDLAVEDAYSFLDKCPLFTNTDGNFLRALALKCVPYLFSPGEPIVYAGDMGREMYFIRRGVCEVLTPNLDSKLGELKKGQNFGEFGMLFGDYRTNTVLAKTHVEVLQLSMEDLDDVLKQFPILKEQIRWAQNNKSYKENLEKAANIVIDDVEDGLHTLDEIVEEDESENEEETPESTNHLSVQPNTLNHRKSVFTTLNKADLQQFIIKLRTPKQSIFSAHQRGSRINSVLMQYDPFVTFTTTDTVENEAFNKPFRERGILGKILKCILMRRTFMPQGRLVKMWTIWMTAISGIILFTIPLQATLFPTSISLWTFHYLVDIICYINIYVGFHFAYYNSQNALVTHPLPTAKHYLRTNFVMDIVGSLPLELIAYAVYPHFTFDALYLFSVVRLNRLLMGYRVVLSFIHLEGGVDKETDIIRMMKFLSYTLIFIHWVTCLHFAIPCSPDLHSEVTSSFLYLSSGHKCIHSNWLANMMKAANTTSNIPLKSIDFRNIGSELVNNTFVKYVDISSGTVYVSNLYWASAVTLSVGYGDMVSSKPYEMVLFILLMVLGVLFFGYIIASVAAALVNADAQRANFQRKLFAIERFLEHEEITGDLQQRVVNYYEYLWLRTHGIDPDTLLRGLPLALWGDVTLNLYQEILRGISMFRNAQVSESFIKVISKYIKPLFILEKEFVVQENDIGNEMYFIHRGSVDVTDEHGEENFATFNEGHSFGEQKSLEYYPSIKRNIMGISDQRRRSQQMDILAVENVFKEVGKEMLNKSRCSKLLPTMLKFTEFTVLESSRFVDWFERILCLVNILSLWIVTFQVSFQHHSGILHVLNYLCDAFFIGKIYLTFHVSYHDAYGDIIKDFRTVRSHYLKRPLGFGLDVASTVPLEIFALAAPSGSKLFVLAYLRILRVLRLFHIIRFFKNWQQKLNISMLLIRMCENIVKMSLILHIFSCIWFAISCPQQTCSPGSWFQKLGADGSSSLDTYSTTLYWCVCTMTLTGYGEERSYSNIEMLFATLVMMAGRLMFGIILGEFAALMFNAESDRVKYDQKLSAIENDMDNMGLSKRLHDKVVSYFDQLWLRNRGININTLFCDAPPCLKSEILLTVTNNMLTSLPLFKDAESGFLRQIVNEIQHIYILPGDFIVRKGDIGDSVRYINYGQVEVVAEEEGSRVIRTMQEGQMFGEHCLLKRSLRSESIRAQTHVEMYSLTKTSLSKVIVHYPKVRAKMQTIARTLYGYKKTEKTDLFG